MLQKVCCSSEKNVIKCPPWTLPLEQNTITCPPQPAKCDKIPLKVLFQWRKNRIKCLWGCPFNGRNIIKCCLGSSSGGMNVKIWLLSPFALLLFWSHNLLPWLYFGFSANISVCLILPLNQGDFGIIQNFKEFFTLVISMEVTTKCLTQEKQRGNSPAQEMLQIHNSCWQRTQRGICPWPEQQHTISSELVQQGCSYSKNNETPPREKVKLKQTQETF